jgi:hypothetical protein
VRILVTGCTPLQINSPHPGRRAQKINVPRALVEHWRSQGHTVDWRLVEVGESIEYDYDLLLVNVAPIGSLNGRVGALGSMWSLTRKIPTLIHFDDWQFRQVFLNFTTLINRGPEYLFRPMGTERYYKGNGHDPDLRACGADLVRVAKRFRDVWTRWMALCPMYPFGDKYIIRQRMKNVVPDENFSFFDPSSLVINSYCAPVNTEPKERAWAMGSLMNHEDWMQKQKFTWPVAQFGTNKTTVREGKTTTLATEEDVRAEYARRWGVVSPAYDHSGSGWFRSRFVYAAQVGSVLYCGPKDGAALGDAYKCTVKDVEGLSDAGLAELAAWQARTLLPKLWNKEQLTVELDKIVGRAVALGERD